MCIRYGFLQNMVLTITRTPRDTDCSAWFLKLALCWLNFIKYEKQFLVTLFI